MTVSAAPPRILCVDDEPDVLAVTCAALRLGGRFRTEAAGSAAQALAWLRNFRVDAILLDVMMPVTDGVAAFRALRELPGCVDTPVLFLSAGQAPQFDWQGPGPAPRGCLGKPFDVSRLALQVQALLD